MKVYVFRCSSFSANVLDARKTAVAICGTDSHAVEGVMEARDVQEVPHLFRRRFSSANFTPVPRRNSLALFRRHTD